MIHILLSVNIFRIEFINLCHYNKYKVKNLYAY